ncbi:hypothetical protein BDZ89DRAFT_1135054 [Hymenopellis radicata]|nr:hypothetical protein BDZ89DRAFT_1135054 [Hymenopellis radicata]
MPPFYDPRTVVTGIKEKIDSVLVQGDRLYFGSALGNLHIYGVGADDNTLVEIKKGLARRSIEQLGFIRDINSLVLLSEMIVTLYPLPTFASPTVLTNAKAAFSFTIHSHIEQIPTEGTFAQPDKQTIPTLITRLVVGCRRKVVVYSWKDGEAQTMKEAPLAHSPRAMTFMTPDRICFAYAPDFAIFDLNTMTATEVTLPLPTSTTASAFTGLTGYMTLGLGAKAKPSVVQINDQETLIVKDNEGYMIGPNGNESRPASVEWPAVPEEVAFVKPYIFSVLPANTVPAPTEGTFHPTTVLQIRSSLSLQSTQNLPFPFITAPTPQHNSTIRLVTPSLSATEGTSVWSFTMKPWSEQIDELIQDGHYADALALLDIVTPPLPDHDTRRTMIRALNAVAHFQAGKYDAAIDTFTELDVNPAKVVALYPESVAGRLSVPADQWVPLFGGPEPPEKEDEHETGSDEGSPAVHAHAQDLMEQLASLPSTGSIRGKFKTGFGSLITGGGSHSPKDDDAASIHSKSNKRSTPDKFHRSVETLIRYLSDRRPKVGGALATMGITPANQSHKAPSLNDTAAAAVRQIIDTMLFKSYLTNRPALVGSLCRVANWCEVSEVEEELRAHKKFGELIDLYKGKKMHEHALELLKQLSVEEDDKLDKVQPSIFYLQKLGPEYMDLVFSASRWMFDVDKDMAFEVFTSEDVELPQNDVAEFLEGVDPALCAKFLEYLIEERHVESAPVHDRLAELYLSMTLAAKRKGDDRSGELYAKLLRFIDGTHHYNVDHLYGVLSSEDLFEARAILLGRLGRHDQALELYAYNLKDHLKAEEYCKRYYPDTSTIFLTLLRIYLRPTAATVGDLLQPALSLISRHSPRLDPVETLKLLPPLVTAQDVRAFLTESLRAPRTFDGKVVRGVAKARGTSSRGA